MLPACILEGSIHKGNNYWFGIIPFFFTSTSILQILTCISGTHSHPLYSGIPYCKCEPNSLSGIGNMAVCTQEPGSPKIISPSPDTEHLIWGGVQASPPCLLIKLWYSLLIKSPKGLCSNIACHPL